MPEESDDLEITIVDRVNELALLPIDGTHDMSYDFYGFPIDINDSIDPGNPVELDDSVLVDNVIKFVRTGIIFDQEYAWNTILELERRYKKDSIFPIQIVFITISQVLSNKH